MKKLAVILLILTSSFGFAQSSGLVWQNPIPQGNFLTNSYAISSNSLISVGYGGTIIKTTNTGLSWQSYTDTSMEIFESVYFVNEYTGWAGGMFKLLKTTNGGINWAVQSSFSNGYIN